MKDADFVGLTEDQARRVQEFERRISQSREGIDAWHRLLDRRRLDRKLGLHPIAEFGLGDAAAGREFQTLVKKDAASTPASARRDPFYVRSESEARGLLIRCVGYLSNPAGEKLAFDKGADGRDKMAEWIIREIEDDGAITYIRKHAPYVFGIEIAVTNA